MSAKLLENHIALQSNSKNKDCDDLQKGIVPMSGSVESASHQSFAFQSHVLWTFAYKFNDESFVLTH